MIFLPSALVLLCGAEGGKCPYLPTGGERIFMWKYIIKRLLTIIPILFLVSFLVFWLMTYTGDPASNKAGDFMTEAELEALRDEGGLVAFTGLEILLE